ncbi:MAG TPA: preprotein translocase subunit YajC [Gammaproteobacteria bacterium]|nr:preprotein translocase subunit YajC [Gammaproteobacteria bacterium]
MISSFFISNAYAADSSPAPAPQGGFSFFIMMGVLIFFMYFAIWRPQTRRAKEQKMLINSLAKGDEVVTAGGILGTISKVSDNYVVLSLTDNVEITIQKSSIVSALPKGTLKSI